LWSHDLFAHVAHPDDFSRPWYVWVKQPDGIAALGSYYRVCDLNLAIWQQRGEKLHKSSLLGRVTPKMNRLDWLAGSDFLEQFFIQIPGLDVLNEIPQQTAHYFLGKAFTSPRISTREGLPVPTDSGDDIPAVDLVDEDIIVHLRSSLNLTMIMQSV